MGRLRSDNVGERQVHRHLSACRMSVALYGCESCSLANTPRNMLYAPATGVLRWGMVAWSGTTVVSAILFLAGIVLEKRL